MKVEKTVGHIVNWLKSYLEDAGSKGFVIGISGGIDSAVTSALVARTGYPVMCVEMPIHQSQDQVTRAARHIRQLKGEYSNVSHNVTDLSGVFDQFVSVLPEVEESYEKKISLVNSRARLRMTTLYYFAGLNSYLVTGTGNKIEDFGVGFYTKYGDGGVDISPIADLLKTEVYELGRHLEIDKEILKAAPTDGLWGDDRTDEDQIGATYPELEWAMEQYEAGRVTEDFSDRKAEVLQIYSSLHRANLHKMKPIPVCEIPQSLRA